MIDVLALRQFLVDKGLLIKGFEFEKIATVKPSHGNCCTCQNCGHSHEECICDHNEWIDFISNNDRD